jgi:CHASE3 domain sensor protein
VLATANQVERLEVDLETGQRGFIITGQERFLEPWNAARAALPEQSRTLEELVADNPVQESRARRIAPTASTPLPTMPVTKRRSTQSRG